MLSGWPKWVWAGAWTMKIEIAGALTTEQLGEAMLRTVEQMTPEEKAAFRQQLDEENRKWQIAKLMQMPVSRWIN